MNLNKNCPSDLIYKFRALDTTINFGRIKDCISSGKFWFSSLWKQNDALEGVYLTNNDEKDFFSEKNKMKICCFSRKEALCEPLMWAHYAGGFKGVAIAVQMQCNDSGHTQLSNDKVKYINKFDADKTCDFTKIITRKTKVWKYEHELRCWTDQEEDGFAYVG